MVFNGHFRNKAYNSCPLSMFIFSCTKERNEEVPFSMAIGIAELMHEWFTNTHAWEQQELNKTMRQTKTDRRGACVWEKSTAGTN